MTQAAVIIYGVHIIIIGLLLYWMRQYVISSPTIRNSEIDHTLLRHGTIRLLFPVISAVVAIAISFVNTEFSLFIFTLAILFNLSARSTTLFEKVVPLASSN